MSKNSNRIFVVFISLAIFVGLWSYLMFSFGPNTFVETLGQNNSYLIGFLVALFGGVSTFTSASFYVTISTLIAGGLNPLTLGLLVGIALFIGDSFFYYFGLTGKKLISNYETGFIGRFSKWLNSHHGIVVPSITYLYIGLTPLPNDILMFALSFGNYSYKKIILPIILGNLTFGLLISYSFYYGFNFFG